MFSAIMTRAATAWERAHEANVRNVETLLSSPPTGGTLLDVGCGDGQRTLRFARAARADETFGLEIDRDCAELARSRGLKVSECDLGDTWPFEDQSFDAVVSNQVIEHVSASDHFVAEVVRVLKPCGLAIVSTENLASWHNVASLIFGWEPFSLTNTNDAPGIGNPLALHREDGAQNSEAMRHARVFAYRGLLELLQSHGLIVRSVRGAGYYPLPATVGRIDPRHAAFLAVETAKPR